MKLLRIYENNLLHILMKSASIYGGVFKNGYDDMYIILTLRQTSEQLAVNH